MKYVFAALLWILAANGASAQYATTPANLTDQIGCGGNLCGPSLEQSIVNTYAGRSAPSVTDYGAKGDGVTDDTTAFMMAAASASALYVPPYQPGTSTPATFLITGLTASSTFFGAPGGGSVIKAKSDAGLGNALLDLNSAYVEDLTLLGPNCSAIPCPYPGLNTAPAQMDGLRDYGSTTVAAQSCSQPLWRNITVEGFRSGFVLNCEYGHEVLDHLTSTNNFYALRILNSGQDIRAFDNNFTGNGLAGIACASSLSYGCLASSLWLGSHLGFEPFGIYQEPGTASAGDFMNQVTMLDTHFESIGNAAIRSEANSGGNMDAVEIHNAGFSFNGSYELTRTATTTGNTSSTTNIVSVTSASGIGIGTRATDNTHASDFSFGTFVVSVGPTGSSGPCGTLTSTQVCLNQEMAGTHTGDSLTFADDQDYTIDLGPNSLSGKLKIIQGIAPFTPGSTGTIFASGGGNGSAGVLFDYNDVNHGPPGTSTDLAISNDSEVQAKSYVHYIGAGAWVGVNVNSGSDTGNNSSVPWQYWFAGKEVLNFPAPVCNPLTTPSALWSSTASTSGADLVMTINTASNLSATTAFACYPTAQTGE